MSGRRFRGRLSRLARQSPSLLLLLATLAGCHRAGSSGAAPSADSRESALEPVAVTVAPVTLRPVQRTVRVVGTLFGEEEVTLTPKVEGRVSRVYHDVGDRVGPGDILLEIDPTDYELAVEEARRALELELTKVGLGQLPPLDFDVGQIPTVVRARAQAENAARKLERAQALAEKRSLSADDLEQFQTAYKVADATQRWTEMETRTTLAAARHKQALLALAEQRLKDARVVVPDPHLSANPPAETAISVPATTTDRTLFVVAQRMVSQGEMVRAFPSVPVFRLVIDQPLKLRASVPERYVAEVKVGQTVLLQVDAFPDRTFQATLTRLNPTIDPLNRTFQLEAHVPNDGGELRPGGLAKLAILTHMDPQARTVPLEAIVTFAGVTKLFVVRDNRAHEQKVDPGTHGTGWVEVSGELDPAALVVTSGHSQLANDAPVRIRQSPGPVATAKANDEHGEPSLGTSENSGAEGL